MAAVTPDSMSELYAPAFPFLEKVKQSLQSIMPPESELLAETIHQSLSTPGKYLRPMLTLLLGAASGPVTDKLVEVAAVTEMIHIATLLHDDVLDDSELRRGKKNIRAQWGNTVSVLSGDFLLAQASLKLANVGNIRLVAIYSQVLADLCDGEVEQIRSSYRVETNWDSYYRKSVCKTASLFSAGCESAAVLNSLPPEQVEAFKDYGRNFGIAFQMIDDLLDYTSSEAELGKPILDDLRHGLLNAPVLLALESDALTESERTQLVELIENLFKECTPERVEQIQAILAKAQALEKTKALAVTYVEKALAGLNSLPDSLEKASLIGLVHYITDRRQ